MKPGTKTVEREETSRTVWTRKTVIPNRPYSLSFFLNASSFPTPAASCQKTRLRFRISRPENRILPRIAGHASALSS